MHQDDFAEFSALLARLAEIYPKKITDETVQAYWGALKDQSIATITRLANQHAKFSKFFPKPFELRPKDDKPALSDPKTDGAFREAEDRAIRNLEDLRQRNPVAWEKHVRDARIAAGKDPNCNAIQLHHQYGEQLWYDLPQRCWRL